MEFAKRMKLLQQLEPLDVTEMTPTNFKVAKADFLNTPSLNTPCFVYENSRSHEDERRLLSAAMGIFTDSGAESEAHLSVLQDYAQNICNQINLLDYMSAYRSRSVDKDMTLVSLVYGEPEYGTYQALLRNELQALLTSVATRTDEASVKQLIADHLAPSDDVGETGLFTPKVETVQAFGELCQKKWSRPLERVSAMSSFSSEDVVELLRAIIREDIPEAQTFQVVLSETKTAMDVSQPKHLIAIPKQRAAGPFTAEILQRKVIGHELMTHVMRTAWAEVNCPEVAVPLAGYIEFEEGVAKAVEQALEGIYYPAGAWHYLAIGMAWFDHATFREVFEAQRTMRFLKSLQAQDAADVCEQKFQKATDGAFQCTMRCFRGTNRLPLTKDLCYFNGQQRVWRLIEKYISSQPEALWQTLFQSGKTDIMEPSHRRLLDALGLTRIS